MKSLLNLNFHKKRDDRDPVVYKGVVRPFSEEDAELGALFVSGQLSKDDPRYDLMLKKLHALFHTATEK